MVSLNVSSQSLQPQEVQFDIRNLSAGAPVPPGLLGAPQGSIQVKDLALRTIKEDPATNG